jgi:hypothetical protein
MAKSRNKKVTLKTDSSPSWRGIKQEGKLRSTTAAAKQKRLSRWGRFAALGLGAIILLGGLAYGIHFSTRQLSALNPAPAQQSLETVDFVSDGVLNESWFRRNFPLDQETASLDYDIFGLQEKLLRHGQIQDATVAIELPSTLIVRIVEKVPVMRLRLRKPDGEIAVMLIASDGSVYEGEEYPPEALRRLPGLDRVRPQWDGDEIRPIPGVDLVAQLLDRARLLFPQLYADWKVVSFERFDGDPQNPGTLIFVKSGFVERITFAPQAFDPQLRKLNEVVTLAREQNSRGLRKVDVSFPGQAIIEEL